MLLTSKRFIKYGIFSIRKNVNCRTKAEVINININKEKYERMIKEIKKAQRKNFFGRNMLCLL